MLLRPRVIALTCAALLMAPAAAGAHGRDRAVAAARSPVRYCKQIPFVQGVDRLITMNVEHLDYHSHFATSGALRGTS
jgi:hypothetical protein